MSRDNQRSRGGCITLRTTLIAWGVAVLAQLWSAHAAVVTNGPAASFVIATNEATGNRSIIFSLSPTGVVEVTPFASDVVRVRFHFGTLFPREEVAIAKPFSNWPSFSSTITNVGGPNLVIQTDQLSVDIVLSNKFKVHFRDTSGYFLLQDLQIEYNTSYHQTNDTLAYQQVAWPSGSTSVSNVPSGFKLKAIKIMPTNEAFFGAGEFAGPLNRRGRTLQYWNQDVFGFEEFRNPMYMSLPFFYGVQPTGTDHAAFAYGVFFNNPARPVMEFQSGLGDTYAFHAGDDQLDYFFFGGGSNHTMKAVLDRYSELTGRPTMLPKWALGYHQSRHSYLSQPIVQGIADAARSNNFPCDAIYLDIGTQSNNFQLTFNAGFTNVPGMISYCTNRGIRLVPLVEPFLLTNDLMYAEAFANLYFLKANDLSTYKGTNFLTGTNAGLSWLDFSQSNFARAWWIGKLTNYLAQYPFESLWNDLNEPNENAMPLDALYFLDGRYGDTSKTDTRKWHAENKNTYNLLECAASYEALRRQQPAKRPYVLSRSGWPGIARYAVGWSGDNVASFDHLRHNIRLGMSVMISGQPNFGSDIGGFNGDDTAELFTRWLEWGVLNPLCRNHTFSSNREPWLFDETSRDWNRRWIQFRYQLMPYLYTLAFESSTNGLPMNTPTVFQFTADTNTWSQNEYDFMVGASLLATPVYVSNSTARTAYLPVGATWYFWQDDAAFSGGQTISYPVSLGTLPMFVRDGGIIPMGPVMDFANEFQPSYLDLHAWPGNGDFTLHEDDGETTNYLAGASAQTRFTSATGSNTWSFTIHARTGGYDPGSRSYFVIGHAVSNVVSVSENGTTLVRYANRGELEGITNDGWSYSTTDRRLIVRVADTGGAIALEATTDDQAVTLDAFSSAYTNMALAGTFTFWNEAARNMRLVTNHLWATVVDLTGFTNIEFKFVANDQWNLANWGDSNQVSFVVPFTQTAESFASSNILATGVFTGRYTFTFNETSLLYGIQFAGLADSDGDGASDEWEFYYGLDPLARGDAGMDLEGDGLTNASEFVAGGSPIRADTDGDGVPDFDEFVAGTGLTNADSFLRVEIISRSVTNNAIELTWFAFTGSTYDVLFSSNVLNGVEWLVVSPFSNLSGAGPISVSDTNPASERSYRLGVRRP